VAAAVIKPLARMALWGVFAGACAPGVSMSSSFMVCLLWV